MSKHTGLGQYTKDQVARFVPAFRRYLDDAERNDELLAQKSRGILYNQLLSPEGLASMSELEFGQVIGSLWAGRLWGNKGYYVDKIIRVNNGLPRLLNALHALLWGQGGIAGRYNRFRQNVRDLGSASITEILTFVQPASYGIWNESIRTALEALGLRESFPALRKEQISGEDYAAYLDILATIGAELALHRLDDLDLLGVCNFLYSVAETARDRPTLSNEPAPTPIVEPENDFDHTEMVDHLVNIGQWLGFEAEKEKMVARGAIVDLIWQARIANLGVVTYVFEVQRRGSTDSLILNLQRAQNNPSVQRLVVVANSQNIERVRAEIASLPETFRKAVGYMDVREVLRAVALLRDFSAIISKLELVRSEFGV
jgi:RimJ/RimL family protein N-acetyltransferase